ncbi:uncharacterized protein [Narcine bancroftii]|uniref:uncharacterized protein isoform X3 n=1 Tax=Narcine bancroftii TaxID=1343680 RepID=UPI003831C320
MLGRRLDPATIEEAASTTKQEEDSDRALQASLAGLKKKLPYKSEEELRPICIAESIESSLRVSKPQRTPARSRLTPSLILPPQDGADTLCKEDDWNIDQKEGERQTMKRWRNSASQTIFIKRNGQPVFPNFGKSNTLWI